MASSLSLEERTIGFFLMQTDNVTCYGNADGKRVIPFLCEGDYALLRQVRDGLNLESPTTALCRGLVQRNPFLGLSGEQAYAIHEALGYVVQSAYSMAHGVIVFAGARPSGYFSFFLELAKNLDVYGAAKAAFTRALDDFEKENRKLLKDENSCRKSGVNLELWIPDRRKELVAKNHRLRKSERDVCGVLAGVASDALRGYVQKYGM